MLLHHVKSCAGHVVHRVLRVVFSAGAEGSRARPRHGGPEHRVSCCKEPGESVLAQHSDIFGIFMRSSACQTDGRIPRWCRQTMPPDEQANLADAEAKASISCKREAWTGNGALKRIGCPNRLQHLRIRFLAELESLGTVRTGCKMASRAVFMDQDLARVATS